MSIPFDSEPPRPAWRRPVSGIRRWLSGLFESRPDASIDHQFARMSVGGYVGTLAPELMEAQLAIRERVTELSRAEALDEGSGHVFDPTIGAWVEQWSSRVDAGHHARQSVLQQYEEAAAAEIEWCIRLTSWTERQLTELDEEIDSLRSPHPHRPRTARPGRHGATVNVPGQRPRTDPHPHQ